MKLKTLVALLVSYFVAHAAAAGHHEKDQGVMLAAQPGQILILYHWPCADAPRGLSLLKEMIAYERSASPYPYSASPGMHADGAVVSVDVHPSADSMEKATAWQAEDEQWQGFLGQMAEACGSVDDLTASVVTMQ